MAYLPKPHDLLAVALVMSINGVPLPIVTVDFLHPTEHQLNDKQMHMNLKSISQKPIIGVFIEIIIS